MDKYEVISFQTNDSSLTQYSITECKYIPHKKVGSFGCAVQCKHSKMNKDDDKIYCSFKSDNNINNANKITGMNWIKYKERKPPMGKMVLAHHKDWIMEDENPKGIRIGFQDLSNDDNGDFISAHYWDYQDCFMTISHGNCDNNMSFSENIKNSIEPELWVSLDYLTDNL